MTNRRAVIVPEDPALPPVLVDEDQNPRDRFSDPYTETVDEVQVTRGDRQVAFSIYSARSLSEAEKTGIADMIVASRTD
jgi:hypothetical protein